MKLLLPVCSLLCLAGCGSAPAGSPYGESAKYSLEYTEKFRLLDRPAQQAVACTGLQERFNEAGLLEIVANLKNRQATAIEMQVRCVFQDAAGAATGDETPWLPLSLDAGATEAVHYFATSNLSRRFTIHVRSVR